MTKRTGVKVGVIGVPAMVLCATLMATLALPAVAAPAAVSPAPSPFETGLNGFGMGIAAGLAGGYLVARSNGLTSSDWRPVVAGATIGALAGGGLGLTLGFVDNASSTPGRGFLVMRDMAYGGAFGAVFGGLVGALAALKTNHLENILFGGAIGILSGTVIGVVIGSVERNPWASDGGGPYARPTAWNLGVTPVLTARGGLALGPALSGQF